MKFIIMGLTVHKTPSADHGTNQLNCVAGAT